MLKFVWPLLGCLVFGSSLQAMPESQLVNRLNPFVFDGCSVSPDGVGTLDWTECCYYHDLAYWQGGTSDQRYQADAELKQCIYERTQNYFISNLYFMGVRIGGNATSSTHFTWGYGWTYKRGYKPLDQIQLEEVKSLKPLSYKDVQLQEHPQSSIRSYPSETGNYCLDEIIEDASTILGDREVVNTTLDLSLPNMKLVYVHVKDCRGALVYDLRVIDIKDCTRPVYSDSRPKFRWRFTNTLSCDKKD